MKLRKLTGALAVAGSLMVFGTTVPAWAAGPSALPWRSPTMITNGVPVYVASIASCPPVPTSGDTVLVQVTLSFGPGGGEGQILSANPDGSWSGDVTFSFEDVNLRQTTISAECLDYTGYSATPYAQYLNHHTQIFD
jgi:hypothetical protein